LIKQTILIYILVVTLPNIFLKIRNAMNLQASHSVSASTKH